MPKKKAIDSGLFGALTSAPAPKKIEEKDGKHGSSAFAEDDGKTKTNDVFTFEKEIPVSSVKISEEKVFGVVEFIEYLNIFFKKQNVRITGEISALKRVASGHVYFSLKDKKDGGVLDSIIWSRNYDMCGVNLEVGMEVILSGHPNVYAATGRLSFVADTVELVGEGALKKAYDALKAKFTAEGIFDPARKRLLPDLARKIGVITSMHGAVIHDFENNLGKFGFSIAVCDSRVEGQQAVASILAALAQFQKEDIEVLVIIRGGGSLESLQAFNNEAVVRAIAAFPVPVIAGIGHDQDVPLAALAADYMTSTPTAAAHLLGRSWEEAFAKIQRLGAVFVRVAERFKRVRTDLDGAAESMLELISYRLESLKERFQYAERSVVMNDPARQLKLGYALTRHNGKILRAVGDIKIGETIETQLSDGTITSKVETI